MDQQKRTWAEISLSNIEHNYRTMRSHLPSGTRFLGVVKADAYGHGALRIGSLLEKIGCDYLATATIDEAAELRDSGIKMPILIFGSTPADCAEDLVAYGITQSVSTLIDAKAYSEAAGRLGKTLKVHIKLDSGMGRLGFSRSGLKDALAVLKLPGLNAEGVFTHFATSEITCDEYTRNQLSVFMESVDFLENYSGHKFEIRHCANSAGMLNYSKAHLDMIRPGIALYGINPDKSAPEWGLRPAMSLKTRIALIRDLPAGECVSYGRTFKAETDRRIAVIPIGYADGLHRVLSNKLEVMLHGRRVRQIGNICMDMCMIDVTDMPSASVGDVVTVFGDGVSACELASKAGTISYEILCSLSPRVPRVYI